VSPWLRPLRAAAPLLLLAGLWLGGCAQPARVSQSAEGPADFWRGRLSLRFDDPAINSYFASFELSGNARNGELNLFSPLGNTVASLRWSPQAALLISGGDTRRFDSLEALAQEATGAALPIAAMFQWLQGQASNVDGWQSDLSQLKDGRLQARRLQPAPAAELRLIIEP
jgi:outer membrane lipoprotein LolB